MTRKLPPMPSIIRQMLEQYAPGGLKALDQLEHGDEEIAALKAERDRLWMALEGILEATDLDEVNVIARHALKEIKQGD
jgi:hypothetical protein